MSKISELSDGGALQSTDYLIAVRSGGNVKVQPNGTVTGTTGSFSGNVTFADNAKAIFGAGSDLQIYHDASNSYIIDNGTGSLFIRGNSQIQLQDTNTAGKFFVGTAGGAATLYHNNAAKLATTATGIDVTGTVTADGLTVDGAGTVTAGQAVFTISSSTTSAGNEAELLLVHAGNNSYKIKGGSDLTFSSDGGVNERLRITNAGNVGIGTSSPSVPLDVVGNGKFTGNYVTVNNTTSYALMIPENTGGYLRVGRDTSTGVLYGTPYANVIVGSGAYPMLFGTNNTERMRIDSSGNVGIGNTSPNAKFTNYKNTSISGSAGATLSLEDDSQPRMMMVADSSTSYISSFNSNPITFSVTAGNFSSSTGTERMRLDASGNLLVGTTNNTLYSSTSDTGVNLTPDGGLYVAADGTALPNFNRVGTDGDIMRFRKDGSTVGSIGTASSGDLYIADGRDAGLKLDGGNNQILPVTSAGAQLDNTLDLGKADTRFKDLYLSGYVKTPAGGGIRSDGALYLQSDASGTTKSAYLNTNGDFVFGTSAQGIYLGGTSSANKLDDYEEGTFTPVVEGATTAGTFTYGTQSGLYTKIGNVVSVHIAINVSATSVSPVGAITVQGLPFSTSGSFQSLAIGWVSGITFADQLNAYAPNSETFVVLRNSVSGNTGNQIAGSNLSSSFWLFISGAYRAT